MGNLADWVEKNIVRAATTPANTADGVYDRLQILTSTGTVLAEFSWTSSDWNSTIGYDGTSYYRDLTNVPITVTAAATGTADHAKLYASGASTTRYIDNIPVGTTGSGNPVEISSLSITSGQPVRLNSLVIKAPNSTTA